MFNLLFKKQLKSGTASHTLLKNLWKDHIRIFMNKMLLSVLLMAIVAICTGATAKVFQPLVDDVFKAEDLHMLKIVAIAMFLIFIIKGFATYGQSVLLNSIGQRVIADVQKRIFTHLIRLDLSFFHNNSSGTLISRCTNDVNLLRQLVTNSLTGLGKDLFTLASLMTVMFLEDWVLALITCIVFPITIIPITRIGRWMRNVSKETQTENGRFVNFLSQTFLGIRVVKAYTMENYENRKAKELTDRLYELSHHTGKIKAISSPVIEAFIGFVVLGIIVYGGLQVINGHNTAGSFFTFVFALIGVYEPLKRIARLNTDIQEGLAATDRIYNLLKIPPRIKQKKDAPALTLQKGQIDFKSVNFAYGPKSPHVIKAINFSVPPGKNIAIVGHSGSGKSTILNLIPRFYDVIEGAILIDGNDVREVSLSSLRKSISLVSQEIMLFDDTIYHNIAYGRMGASLDDVKDAAQKAAAHDFIMQLPDQYQTIVGESGIKLSGGQRQRLSIARAFLKDAPILLLDEATSALDTESERLIQDTLKTLMKGRTSVVIAHRLSTIKDADQIYVLDEGSIVEHGTHRYLLSKEGLYKKLCQLQVLEDN